MATITQTTCWLIFMLIFINVINFSNANVNCTDGKSEDPEEIQNTFNITDYIVLLAMLLISCAIGFFVGIFGEKQTTSDDFLLGNSEMGTLPMALSLAASFITAIELLGNPSEFYNHGSQFFLICISFILVVPLTSHFYLPVFMKLRLTSAYEYLEMRFDSNVRLCASGLYILQMLLYTSVAVFAPALALSHVTGLNTYMAVTMVYFVCIFYASQGGMKAVILTDTFQAMVLLGSIILMVILGQNLTPGGFSEIWSDIVKTERLEPIIFNPDPTIRHSIWSVVIGGTVYWLSMYCASQASIQKYLSVQSINQVRKALWVSSIGLIIIYCINLYMGAILYSNYKECDPKKEHIIHSPDQMLALYVMNVLGKFTGVPGFFVAGIFAASLGTVASAINSLAAITINDFLINAFGIQIPENKGAVISRYLSILYGIVSFALIFIVERLGSVLQMTLSFNGMVGGVILGLFTLGMFFPWANSKGALVGTVISFFTLLWIGIGTQIAQSNGFDSALEKETSIIGCDKCYNLTYIHVEILPVDQVFYLYRISYLWYSCIGLTMTVVIGLLVSWCTGVQDPTKVHADLQSPPMINFWSSFSDEMKIRLGLPSSTKDTADEKPKNKYIITNNYISSSNNNTQDKMNLNTFADHGHSNQSYVE